MQFHLFSFYPWVVACVTICHGLYIQSDISSPNGNQVPVSHLNEWTILPKDERQPYTGAKYPDERIELSNNNRIRTKKFSPELIQPHVNNFPIASTIDNARLSNNVQTWSNYKPIESHFTYSDFKPEKPIFDASSVPAERKFPIDYTVPVDSFNFRDFVPNYSAYHRNGEIQNNNNYIDQQNLPAYLPHPQSYSSPSHRDGNTYETNLASFPAIKNLSVRKFGDNLRRSVDDITDDMEYRKEDHETRKKFPGTINAKIVEPLLQNKILIDEQQHSGNFSVHDIKELYPEGSQGVVDNLKSLDTLNNAHAQSSNDGFDKDSSSQYLNYTKEADHKAEQLNATLKGAKNELGLEVRNVSDSFRHTDNFANHNEPIGSQMINSILEKVHQPHGNIMNNIHRQYAKSLVNDNRKVIDDGGLEIGYGIAPVKSEIEQVHLGQLPEGDEKFDGAVDDNKRKLSTDLNEALEHVGSSYILNEPLSISSNIQNNNNPVTESNQEERFSIKELIHPQPGLQEFGGHHFNDRDGKPPKSIHHQLSNGNWPLHKELNEKSRNIQNFGGVKQKTVLTPGKQGSVKFISPAGPGKPALRVITLGNRGNYVLPDGIKIQPGGKIPGTMGLKVPTGFRAHVIFGSAVADSIRNEH